MNKKSFGALLSLLVASTSALGCAADSGGGEPIELPDLAGDEAAAAPAAGEPVVLATVTTPTGSTLRFLQIRAEGADGVLVLEGGDDGALVLDRLLDHAGVELGAREIFAAVTGPGTEIPEALPSKGAEEAASLPRGWAIDLIEPVTTMSGSEFACNNDSFTSSTPGGLLADVFTRLDTNDEQNPSLWDSDCYAPGDGHCYGDSNEYNALWYGMNKWRGKACGYPYNRVNETTHTFCSPSGGGCFTVLPEVWFLYKSSSETWQQAHLADSAAFSLNTTQAYAWYYNGASGASLDWKLRIRYAKAWDEFDILMSRP
jgi:hypothetical protein